MEYRRLGRAGMKVSAIALGNWLTHAGYVAEEAAVACVKRAYELGITLFDTANAYNQGAAEEVLGQALKRYDRSSYVLATKVFFPMGDGPNDRGLSRKHIVEQCHASLRRLGMDYLDLYQCHRYDPQAPLDETLRALDDLISAGKILYVGVSEWSAVQLGDAIAFAREHNMDQIVSNQPQYSLLHRAIERDVVPLCAREGIGQIVYSPLAQGVLAGRYKPGQPPPPGSRATDEAAGGFVRRWLQDDVLEGVARLEPIARDHGLTVGQLSLAWVLRRPTISSAIIGASRPQQIEENAAAVEARLDDATLAHIEEIVGPLAVR